MYLLWKRTLRREKGFAKEIKMFSFKLTDGKKFGWL